MVGAAMIMATNNRYRLADKRVKWVGNRGYRLIKLQTPGTISSAWRRMMNSTSQVTSPHVGTSTAKKSVPRQHREASSYGFSPGRRTLALRRRR
jgi:hypothetical protein